jgi:hypothetical protein
LGKFVKIFCKNPCPSFALQPPLQILEKSYIRLNGGKFKIIEDIPLYDDAMKRQISYLPERIPFFDCLYLELMEQLKITKIATFDKHFNNKGIEVITSEKNSKKMQKNKKNKNKAR